MFNFVHLIAYLRKSRADGEQSVEEVLIKHEQILNDFCVREYGQKLSEEQIYREVKSGETISSRPVLQEVLSRIKNKEVEGILVVDLQRLSRGDLVDTGTLSQIFSVTAIPIITPQHEYHIDNKYDRKFFEMELMRGNDYLEYTKEILRRGRENAVKQGWYINTPPYGYDRDYINKKPTLKINEQEANIVRMIFSWYTDEDMGKMTIAKKLNEMGVISPRCAKGWTARSLTAILNNPVYIGHIRYNYKIKSEHYEDGELKTTYTTAEKWDEIQGRFPSIISVDQYNKSMEKYIPPVKTTYDMATPLSGLFVCSKCGSKLTNKCKGKIYLVHTEKGCSCKQIRYENVEKVVLNALQQVLEDITAEDSNTPTLIDYQSQIAVLVRQRDRLVGLLAKEVLDESDFEPQYKSIKNQIEELQRKDEEQKKNPILTPEEKQVSLLKILEELPKAEVSNKTKNKLLRQIIKAVYVFQSSKDSLDVRLELLI